MAASVKTVVFVKQNSVHSFIAGYSNYIIVEWVKCEIGSEIGVLYTDAWYVVYFGVVVSILTYCVQIWLQERDVPITTTVTDHRNKLNGAWIESLATTRHRGCTIYVQAICVSTMKDEVDLMGHQFYVFLSFEC